MNEGLEHITNCGFCKKRFKKNQEKIYLVTKDGEGFGCPKCIEKYSKETPTTSAVLIEGNQSWLVCNHCGMKTQDKDYWLNHECDKVNMQKEFVRSLAGDKDG